MINSHYEVASGAHARSDVLEDDFHPVGGVVWWVVDDSILRLLDSAVSLRGGLQASWRNCQWRRKPWDDEVEDRATSGGADISHLEVNLVRTAHLECRRFCPGPSPKCPLSSKGRPLPTELEFRSFALLHPPADEGGGGGDGGDDRRDVQDPIQSVP